MLDPERLLHDLRHGDESQRHRAAELLGEVPRTPHVLAALVEALADDGFYETPGDYDAPPFHHAVARAAANSLKCPEVASVRARIVEQAQTSRTAAFYAPELLALAGEPTDLLELLKHPEKSVREQAVASIRVMMNELGVKPLLRPLLESLLDDEVAWRAVNELERLIRDYPELELNAPDLVEPLVARMYRHPGACTYFAAAALLYDQVIRDAWLELATRGSHCAAEQLRKCTNTFTDEEVSRLVEAPLNKELLSLWARLRDPTCLPRLVPCLDDPAWRELALGAILSTRGGPELVRDRLGSLFLEEPALRPRVVDKHPDPSALAAGVLPFVRERLGGAEIRQRDGLKMMEALGPLAASLVPQVVPLTRVGVRLSTRLFALDALVAVAPTSQATLDVLASYLDWHDTREYALRKIIALGPAASSLADLLEVLALEMRRNGPLLDQAREAVTGRGSLGDDAVAPGNLEPILPS